MNTIISTSKALTKWLNIDIPRMPSPDGKRIGTQPLVTDSHTISWQCHVIQNRYKGGGFTVIAVEAYSRFTLLLPFDYAPTQEELQAQLLEAWIMELVTIIVELDMLGEEQVGVIFDRFYQVLSSVKWWRNTDLSINGHVADADQWVKQTINDHNVDALSEDDAEGLARHINQFSKSAKDENGKKQRFYPVPRFLEDGLYRFASGLFDARDFANVHPVKSQPVNTQGNVVSLADYRAKLKGG